MVLDLATSALIGVECVTAGGGEFGTWKHPSLCLGTEWGGAPVARGSQGQGLGVGREKLHWVVSQGAEAFETGHTCLSCERPYSPWLAGIPEQRQRELSVRDRGQRES